MDTTKKTPVNSIVIPARFVDLCGQWYNGRGDLLYAVSSTGNLTIGDRCPMGCTSEEKWYLFLWMGLANDVGYAVRSAKKGLNSSDENDGGDGDGHDRDYPLLVAFETYADEIADQLAIEYGLDDWEETEA